MYFMLNEREFKSILFNKKILSTLKTHILTINTSTYVINVKNNDQGWKRQ